MKGQSVIINIKIQPYLHSHLSLNNTQNKLIIFNVYMLGLISVLSFNNTDLMDWYLEKGYSIHT